MRKPQEELVPPEMQVRQEIVLVMNVTASMKRGLIAWLDRMGYAYRVEESRE